MSRDTRQLCRETRHLAHATRHEPPQPMPDPSIYVNNDDYRFFSDCFTVSLSQSNQQLVSCERISLWTADLMDGAEGRRRNRPDGVAYCRLLMATCHKQCALSYRRLRHFLFFARLCC